MNKWKKSWIAIFMVLMLMLSGCGADVQGESQPSKDQTVTEQQQETVEQEDWEIIDESEPTINIGEIPEYSGEAYVTIANNIPNFTDSELKTESFETYSDLDSLGRCGIAYANIGQDLMPTEDRGSIGQVKPSGWHTVKYDCVDGKYLYNRCHLIIETSFYKIFSEEIPDCCIINVDEPGNEIEKERDFRKILAETYIRLKEVL